MHDAADLAEPGQLRHQPHRQEAALAREHRLAARGQKALTAQHLGVDRDALEQERPVVHELEAQHAARAGHEVPHRLGVEEQAQRDALTAGLGPGLGTPRRELGVQALVRAQRQRQPLPQRLELLELVALERPVVQEPLEHAAVARDRRRVFCGLGLLGDRDAAGAAEASPYEEHRAALRARREHAAIVSRTRPRVVP